MRRQYEQMLAGLAAERVSLQQRQLGLQKQLADMANSRATDRLQIEKAYKRKVRASDHNVKT